MVSGKKKRPSKSKKVVKKKSTFRYSHLAKSEFEFTFF